MTLLDDLKKNGASFSLTYYGSNDLDTFYTIKALVDHSQYFLELLNKEIGEVHGEDDYVLCLIKIKISKLESCIPIVKGKAHQEILSKLIGKSKDRRIIGLLIKYINHHISEIISWNNREIIHSTLIFIQAYQTGIDSEVLQFLLNSGQKYYLLYHFEDFKECKNNFALSEKLLNDDEFFRFNNINTVGKLINICSIIDNYKNKRFKSLSDEIIGRIYQKYIELSSNVADAKVVLQLQTIGEALFSYFKSKKKPQANNVRSINKALEKIIDKHIEKHGSKFEEKIPVGKILKEIFANKNPYSRIIGLTHTEKDGIFRSNLSIHQFPKCLADLASSNIKTDSYYTFSR